MHLATILKQINDVIVQRIYLCTTSILVTNLKLIYLIKLHGVKIHSKLYVPFQDNRL